MILIHVIAAWFLADLMSGVVHWVMDKKLSVNGLFPGVAEDNIVHHTFPEQMTKLSKWENINTTAHTTLGITTALYFLGAPFFLQLSFFFLTYANLVHRYAHSSKSKTPAFVRFLQKTGIFLSPAHHAKHHRSVDGLISREDTKVRFCVMSNFMNPIVDFIRGH